MIYTQFQDLTLSQLGLGAMRLPIVGDDVSNIDEQTTFDMVDYAIKNGINYFDTAWGYHNGNSQIVMGNALKRYPRESFYLANKFPGYELENMGKTQEIFEKQLKKCQVEYFDFYLYHNVCEMNVDAYLDTSYGTHEYLMEQKKLGRIKHLGFSVHGTLETMTRFLNAYGKDMEFCQVQLNYIDYDFQNAKAKLDLLKEWNIPVWVMEPVRGGKLASLDDTSTAKLKALRPNESVVGWAFRFQQTFPQIKVVLSGMSNFEQLKQNVETFKTDEPLNGDEMQTLFGIAKDMTAKTALACTSCRYCTSHCPKGIDIPRMIELYNEDIFTGGGFRAPFAMLAIDEDKQPHSCIGCKSCEAVCPQCLPIADTMSKFASRLVNRPLP